MQDLGGKPNYRTRIEGHAHRQNKVHDTPITRRDLVVAYDRIYEAKQWFRDGGAFYNLSALPGMMVAENHIFDIGSRVAIYLDEGSR